VLHDKRILVTGVATPDSIAAATATRCLELGARVVLTAFPRDLEGATEAARAIDPSLEVLPLDLTDRAQVDDVVERAGALLGGLDGAVHAVAFASRQAMDGALADAEPAAVELAFRTSAWSLSEVGRVLARLAPSTGGSLVGFDFDSGDRAWPVYNWMGVCKAALCATARYLARDLGGAGIRVNLVSSGPLHTRAADAVPGFDKVLAAWASTSPLRWDPTDPTPVADAACFLLGDLARAVTGEVLHADGGYHAMAAPLRD
jgi:enoyl-[acyl-carrier protein] reductase I